MKNNKHHVYKANIGKLIELYPFIFNKNTPKILAIGLYQQLAMDVREDDYNLSNAAIRASLAIWTNRHEYLREIIKPNSMRYNLDGSVQGEVSDEHKKAAITRKHKNRLASKRARQKRIALEEERVSEIDKGALRCLMKM
jgi:sRNA-binding protein